MVIEAAPYTPKTGIRIIPAVTEQIKPEIEMRFIIDAGCIALIISQDGDKIKLIDQVINKILKIDSEENFS